MSAVNRAPKGAPRAVRTQRLGLVTVAWAVSREAAAVWGIEPGDGEVELRWVLDLDAGTCRVVISNGSAKTVLAEGAASSGFDDGLMHVEATAGADNLRATLRGEQVMYAKTSVLQRSGIAGGRYEVVR